MKRIVVFDLDGTIAVNSTFYRQVYSDSLDRIVEQQRGTAGLEVLQLCRQQYDGKGQLALFALNIPYREWARMLTEAPLDLWQPQPALVAKMRAIDATKVVYTGSPLDMAQRILQRLGFSRQDFDLVIGWQEPELLPVKWTCSPLIFQGFLDRFQCQASQAWAVGDNWNTDLMPAQTLGIRTAQIGGVERTADRLFPTLEAFLEFYAAGCDMGV